ncbi:MAG TPA: Uma2 family endonuclease [Gemmataceae bacterium]|nr:Uma2 family endonuclease [Gemmataceae bacterium]
MILTKSKTKLGPRHHGRKMSLKEFEFAKVQEGWLCELARGYVVGSEVANYFHGMQIIAINRPLWTYDATHPGVIHAILGSMECKLLIPKLESERHPDIAVYLTAPKGRKDRTMWRAWIPDLAIEVVSESSRDRDYTEKRDEYWALRVKEYWIVDAKLEQVLVLKRGRSQWTEKTLGPGDVCETTLLPGFKLPIRTIFDAAREEPDA